MYKIILVSITCSLLNAQAERKSIHQTELEYNKAFYLEPTFRPVLEKAKPLKPREKDHLKPYLDTTLIGLGQNGRIIILIY